MPPQPRTNASKFMVELYQILGGWGIFWGRIPPGGESASTLVVVLVCFPWLRCFALAQKCHYYNPLRGDFCCTIRSVVTVSLSPIKIKISTSFSAKTGFIDYFRRIQFFLCITYLQNPSFHWQIA